MRKLAILAAVLVLGLGSHAQAAVLIGVQVHIRFLPNCPATDGYYQTVTDGTPSPPQAISWSSDATITFRSDGPRMTSTFAFRLLGEDQNTVLFERPFDKATGPDGPTQYWLIQTVVDCTTIPYQEVADPLPQSQARPSTVMPALIGGAAVLLLGLLAFARLRRN